MIEANYPSPIPTQRRADWIVHLIGLTLILTAGGALVFTTLTRLEMGSFFAVIVYVICALVSNIASSFYHFSPFHDRRKMLRRIDHAAIYPSISGTFTPFFVQANTTWTLSLLVICWALTLIAMWNKITNPNVKSKWSTASYLGLGAIGMLALPDLTNVPASTLYCIIAGAGCYVIGTAFYAQRALPYRYAIWHSWVNFGSILMFVGIWVAMFY